MTITAKIDVLKKKKKKKQTIGAPLLVKTR